MLTLLSLVLPFFGVWLLKLICLWILKLLGFGILGPIAGTFVAWWQSLYAGAGPAGGGALCDPSALGHDCLDVNELPSNLFHHARHGIRI
ncbi:hypothetical protein V8F06_011191 [Rhypophila decipiens]